ncbi:MAG: hypothetical protein WAQ98_13945 [Blastocatellia bacterium]
MSKKQLVKGLVAYRMTEIFIILIVIFGISCPKVNLAQAQVKDRFAKHTNTTTISSDNGNIINKVFINLGNSVVKLRFNVDGSYQSYQIEIITTEGKTIWTATGLKAKNNGSTATVLLKIPANVLTSSNYYAKLSGVADNLTTSLANYPFVVKVSTNNTAAQNDPIQPLTATPSAGTGVFGSGATDDDGVIGVGNGSGAGVKGIGSSNSGSPGVIGSGGTNGGIGIQAFGTSGSTVVRGFGVYAVGASSNTDGDVAGVYATSTSKGVVGYGNSNPNSGTSNYNHGVYGSSGKGDYSAGVFGDARRTGDSTWDGYGVYGRGSVAIFGQGAAAQGADPYGGNGVGVQGTGSRGVQGEGYGVGSIGVVGVVGNDTNAVGVFGAAGSGALAGRFEGNVNVNGNLNISGTLTGANLPTGPAGPTGATGATGPQGPVGATGATGATGPQGAGLPTISTTTISYATNGAFTVTNNITGAVGDGIIGRGSNNNGTGVLGYGGGNVNGDGVYGEGSGTGKGIFGRGGSNNGIGVYGQGGAGVNGIGVRGVGGSGAVAVEGLAVGNGTGVVGKSESGDGVIGIGGHGGYGIKGIGGTGGQIGILGQGTSSFPGVKGIGGPVNGSGVEGQATANGAGVVGNANPNSNDSIGVLGTDGGNSANLAGKFLGNVQVTGNIAGGSKTFKIDHPLDPENKYLYHVSVESPDMMNIYNGNITTDANGEAIVTMPTYFDALNAECRYQLTVIGQFAQAIVSNEIINNQFTIKTNKPNVKVSWQVTGIRKDPYAEKYRVQVEVDKAPQERGLYVNPDVYNQPADKAIGVKTTRSEYLQK